MNQNPRTARQSHRRKTVVGRSGWCTVCLAATLSACGGGGGGGAGSPGSSNSYAVGGTVSGLLGSGLVLQNNGGDDLTLSVNGTFTFQTKLEVGASYQVSIKAQPSGPTQGCNITDGSGTLGASAVTNVVVACGPIALLAGALGGPGALDGDGSSARFYYPLGVAIDHAGNLYTADSANNTIRMVTPAGAVSTLAGTAGQSGSADGSGAAARFSGPTAIAIDAAGNLYVADDGNDTIRRITPAGVVSTLAGTAGQSGSTDGVGTAARFSFPVGIAVDSAGNVYVADAKYSPLRKITPDGVVSTPALVDSTSCLGAGASGGLAVDSAGNVYMAGRAEICKISPTGMVSVLAGSTPPGSPQEFSDPNALTIDSAGNVYVADTGDHTIRQITPAGVVSTLAGVAGQQGFADGSSAAARFNYPGGVATDSAGNVYVADTYNDAIRRITPGGEVTTLAGMTTQSGSSDGNGDTARFDNPAGITVDSSGNLYVADQNNSAIRKITSSGEVSTLAGTARQYGSADGTGAAARFYLPTGVTADSAGNLYVADTGSHTIRKITPGRTVSTLAGTAGQVGSADGVGGAASFDFPYGVAADSAGNVYVADTINQTIRRITPGGVVSTFAGTAHQIGSTDGNGSAARFNFPEGVAVDSAGNIYVADTYSHTIRAITTTAQVSTLAGMAGQPGSGDGSGGAARFKYPEGVATDSTGNIYVADTGNGTIRKITPNGTVTTVAGMAGVQGIRLGPLPGSLNVPSSVAVLPGSTVKLVEVGVRAGASAEDAVVEIQLP